MTYADMITLLLCFFAIFLSVSVPRKDVPKKVEIVEPLPLLASPTIPVQINRPLRFVERVPLSKEESVAAPSAEIDKTSGLPSIIGAKTPSLKRVTRPTSPLLTLTLLHSPKSLRP